MTENEEKILAKLTPVPLSTEEQQVLNKLGDEQDPSPDSVIDNFRKTYPTLPKGAWVKIGHTTTWERNYEIYLPDSEETTAWLLSR